MESHKKQILKALMKGKKLTKLEILVDFGCWNSGGRISELRQEGWPIQTEMFHSIRKNKTYAVYFIKNEDLIKLRKL